MKAEDEIEELLAKNMHYHQPSFIAGFKKGAKSQLRALKEEVEELEADVTFSSECYTNGFNGGLKATKRAILNLITNLEDN